MHPAGAHAHSSHGCWPIGQRAQAACACMCTHGTQLGCRAHQSAGHVHVRKTHAAHLHSPLQGAQAESGWCTLYPIPCKVHPDHHASTLHPACAQQQPSWDATCCKRHALYPAGAHACTSQRCRPLGHRHDARAHACAPNVGCRAHQSVVRMHVQGSCCTSSCSTPATGVANAGFTSVSQGAAPYTLNDGHPDHVPPSRGRSSLAGVQHVVTSYIRYEKRMLHEVLAGCASGCCTLHPANPHPDPRMSPLAQHGPS